MKRFLLLLLSLVSILGISQSVIITGPAFTINHGNLTFYLDQDTASFVSVHYVSANNLDSMTGLRCDKWHKEFFKGPYNKEAYLHSGYDLGHLTPSDITSYDSILNYHSFSFFNQAPQLAGFNRGKWAQLENKVEKLIKAHKGNSIVVTGVIYDNNHKSFLGNSRIKLPILFYKMVLFNPKEVYVWIGSNINGIITEIDTMTLLEIAYKNGNKINFTMNQ